MTPTTYTNQTKTHGPHVFFLQWVNKNNMSQKLEKGTEMEMTTIPLLLQYTPIMYFSSFQIYRKIFRMFFSGKILFFYLGCLFFFGKPKDILVLLTTKARLRDCSNEVSCWKCSKDLWWPEFFGLFGWGDGHLRVYTTAANAKPSTKALLRDIIFFKGQWWVYKPFRSSAISIGGLVRFPRWEVDDYIPWN